MKLTEALDVILLDIKDKNLTAKNVHYSTIQVNLRNAKIVSEFVLREKLKRRKFIVDVSEYFNLLIIQIESMKDSPKELDFIVLCKELKTLFVEGHMDINVALLLGDIGSNDFHYHDYF